MKSHIQVQVNASGEVRVDGVLTTIEQLDLRFGDLAKVGGHVWYYREAAQREPPANAMRVLELVVKHRLGITMSSKPDFSDYIDACGVSHPRS